MSHAICSERPRVLCYSSGSKPPCGIVDYQARLTAALAADLECATIYLPTDRVPRRQVLRLWKRRRHFVSLAAQSAQYDVVLLQYFPLFWNYGSRGEDLFSPFMDGIRCPSIAVVHEQPDADDEDQASGGWWIRTMKRWGAVALEQLNGRADAVLTGSCLKRCTYLLVHSPGLRNWLLTAGVPADRIMFRLHPVFPASAPVWEREEIDSRFQLFGRQVILMFGFPHVRKGFDLAIQALALLPREVVLLWVGSFLENDHHRRDAQQLWELSTALGVSERFRMLGFLSPGELTSVLMRSDVAVAPFRDATGSGSLGHILASGLPVIASDLEAIRPLRDAGAGIVLIPPGEIPSLAKAVTNLLGQPRLIAELRGLNLQFAQRHSFDKLARELTPIIRDLADQYPPVSGGPGRMPFRDTSRASLAQSQRLGRDGAF